MPIAPSPRVLRCEWRATTRRHQFTSNFHSIARCFTYDLGGQSRGNASFWTGERQRCRDKGIHAREMVTLVLAQIDCRLDITSVDMSPSDAELNKVTKGTYREGWNQRRQILR